MPKYYFWLFFISLLLEINVANAGKDNIVRDGEYYFLQSQFADEWALGDTAVDKKLEAIRSANGGKRPNIIYILIDDVSFGQMGNRTLNYVTGIKTPNINNLANRTCYWLSQLLLSSG